MRVLLTGGSGDLGTRLIPQIAAAGDAPSVIDPAPPRAEGIRHTAASITDRDALAEAMKDVDCVVHIAAWHGIHEANGTKTPADFHDLNVTGTFNVLQAAVDAGVKKVLFISSTSVSHPHNIYGNSKLVGESIVEAFAHRHDMDAITLRPRAFIPADNKSVYKSFAEWALWYARGAVHVDDVAQAVMKGIDYLKTHDDFTPKAPIFTVDGAHDYTAQDLEHWDQDGPGTTFEKHYPGMAALAIKHGLDPAKKPKVLEMEDTVHVLGYTPQYSMRNMLDDLKRWDKTRPPKSTPPTRKGP